MRQVQKAKITYQGGNTRHVHLMFGQAELARDQHGEPESKQGLVEQRRLLQLQHGELLRDHRVGDFTGQQGVKIGAEVECLVQHAEIRVLLCEKVEFLRQNPGGDGIFDLNLVLQRLGELVLGDALRSAVVEARTLARNKDALVVKDVLSGRYSSALVHDGKVAEIVAILQYCRSGGNFHGLHVDGSLRSLVGLRLLLLLSEHPARNFERPARQGSVAKRLRRGVAVPAGFDLSNILGVNCR